MVRNEIDRFGFSSQIQLLHNLESLPTLAKCSWVHGWKWYEINDVRLLESRNSGDKFRTKIVTNKFQKDFLLSKSYKSVYIGGLPFAYILKSPLLYKTAKFDNKNIIAICPKSQYGFQLRNSFKDFVCFILDDKELRSNVVFCIFKHNLEDSLVKFIKNLNIPIIDGADPFNKLDLIKMKSIFSNFTHMITNTPGSHIPYCAALGLAVNIIEPFDSKTHLDIFNLHEYAQNDTTYIDYLVHVHSKEYFQTRYSDIFTFNSFNYNLKTWGYNEIGFNNLLDTNTIYELFGWTMKGKIRVYKESIFARLTNLII